ncbi:glycosyl transferase family 1 [Candidatus Borrelia fainii]|uniref:Glycosyl transferase family 1 n=1 Tax=Candidatus Borrelia fainii TaxID=2518322 RepID=A0ABM8DJV6_9SPIR|nr:glycosyltransferase [Candidatus Borrelia fainii]BDU62867.1 glycosyl transferase family 1 [Candidatus Borrelia fainii]
MKIAIFTDTYLPDKNGVATSIKQIKEGFERKGHSVYIFCPQSQKTDLQEDHVYRCFSIKLNHTVDAKIAFPNKTRIKKIIQEYQPEIIHTHSEFTMGKIGKKLALQHNIPIVHTNHTMWNYYLHYLGIFKYLTNPDKMMKKFYDQIHHFIYPSIKSHNKYFHLATNADYKIIPNGIDRKIFIKDLSQEKRQEILTKHGISKNDKIIIFVGRINEEKNICLLMKYLKKLLIENKNCKLILIGKGKEETKVRRFRKQYELEKQIILIGTIPWEEMYYYYKISDVFASLSRSEVYPMTTIEALTAGIPAVLINDIIYKDVIQQGKNGFLIDDYENLHKYIKEIIENEEKLQTLKKNTEETSVMFSSSFFVEKIEQYYFEIIKNKKILI